MRPRPYAFKGHGFMGIDRRRLHGAREADAASGCTAGRIAVGSGLDDGRQASQASLEAGPLRSRWHRLAWLPIPLLAAAMVALWAADLPGYYESPFLLIAFNLVFSTLASLFVAYLIARSFLIRGEPGLLMLGCGVLIWGAAGGLVAVTASRWDINVLVTTHNTSVWLSALCHLAGAVLSRRTNRALRDAGLWLTAAYTVALGCVGFVTLSALAGWTPTFFVQGQGGTPLRSLLLGSAAAMFVAAALLLRMSGRKPLSAFLHWYTLALGLIAVGLFGIMIESVLGGPLSWTGRAAQFLGGAYMLLSAIASVRESRVWAVPLEESLQRERTFVSAVLETVGALVTVLDRQGRIVTFNRACEEATGYRVEEVKGRCFWEFMLTADEMEPVKDAFARLRAGEFPNEHENYWVAKDGTRRLIHWTNSCLTDPSGAVEFVIGTGIEVTEWRQAEGALRQSREDLDRAQEVGQIGWWRLDTRRNVLTWSDETYRIFGMPKGAPLSYETFLGVIHPDDREFVDAKWSAGLRGEPYDIEHRIVADGQVKWVREKAFLEFDDAGGLLGGFGITQDITDRKEAEAALRESEERLRVAQAAGRVGTFDWDLASQEARCSEEYFRVMNRPWRIDGKVALAEWQSWLHPEDRDRALAALRAAMDGTGHAFGEYRMVGEDGQTRWILYQGEISRDPQGRAVRMLGTAQDTTQRKRAEEEIRLLSLFPEQNPNPVLRLARDGVILYANSASEQLLTFWNVRRGEPGPPEWHQRVTAVLASGKVMETEITFDGRVYSCFLTPICEQGYVNLYARDVTAHRQAEESLRQAKEDWERTFNSVPDLVAILDPQHRIVRVNRAMAEWSKLTPEQCEGRCCYEIMHGTCGPLGSCPHVRTCREGCEHSVEIADPRRDVHFLVTTSPQCDAQGRVIRVVHVARDITPLKKTEKAVQQLNAELERRVAEQTAEIRRQSAYHRSLIEASIDPLVTVGPDGKITDVNVATERVTGRHRDELVGTEFSDYFTESDKAKSGCEQAFREDLVRNYPLDVRHVDGHATPVVYNATVYRTEAGEIAGVVAVARDISELRRAEQRLQAERQRLYDLLETLPVYVALLSPDYRVPFANRFFRERFGESHGRCCFEFLFERTEPCENCETYKVLKTGSPHHWEWTGPDGRDYDISDFPFVDTDGSTLILEMGIDITERRKAEADARRMRDELGRVDRMARMGELTASLAHEINQPLAAILSNAQAARRFLAAGPPDLNEIRAILDDIIQDDKRAGSVIHRLRLMLQTGKQEAETFDVNEAVRDVALLLHSEVVGRNAALSTDLASGLPAVHAGRVETQQVLVNLLLNALDALNDVPGDRRRILVRTSVEEDAVVVAVRDGGCGIQSPDLSSVFESFFTTKPAGLGMGLAISRRMVQAYGGHIWAANNEDAGATVSFSLPCAQTRREPSDG